MPYGTFCSLPPCLEGLDHAGDVRAAQVVPQPEAPEPFPELVLGDFSLPERNKEDRRYVPLKMAECVHCWAGLGRLCSTWNLKL